MKLPKMNSQNSPFKIIISFLKKNVNIFEHPHYQCLTCHNILCTVKQCYFLNYLAEVDLRSVKTTWQVEERSLVISKVPILCQ